MNKDKIKSLATYIRTIQDKLSSPTPKKHSSREAQYRAFLQNELSSTQSKLERLKTQ